MLARRRVLLHGAPFSYLEAGPDGGPCAILLHGFPDLPTGWEPVMRTLAESGVRTVAPFMRGYAPSTLEGPFHAAQLGADVLALVDALSPTSKPVVVGHDWGAVAAYAAASAAPSRVAHLVTLSVPHPLALLANIRRHPRQLRRSWYMAFFQLRVIAERTLAHERLALVERLWRAWSPGLEPPAVHLDAIAQCFAASMPAPIGYYRALSRRTLSAVARRIDVPCLYLHGADDGCVGPELAEGQGRHFPAGYEESVVPRAGHFLQLEEPETVAERVLRVVSPLA